ncbi:MAG: helix-turn-helix domain-containing protein [Haloarculaceae archaeon]
MSTEDTPDVDPDEAADPEPDEADAEDVRERLEREADRAVEQFDQGIVDLLSWVLDTETRARIYVHLRQNPAATSEEVAAGTGLYPSTVREALAELHDEGKVTRVKRESSGAGNNPYEYSAIPPSDLVQDIVEDLQSELNTVFNLDNYLGGDDEPETEPVTVTVTEEHTESTGEDAGMDEGAAGRAGDSGTNVPVSDESDDGDPDDDPSRESDVSSDDITEENRENGSDTSTEE